MSYIPLKLFFHILFPPNCYVWIETFVILPYRPLDAYLADDVFVTHQKRVHLPHVRPSYYITVIYAEVEDDSMVVCKCRGYDLCSCFAFQ